MHLRFIGLVTIISLLSACGEQQAENGPGAEDDDRISEQEAVERVEPQTGDAAQRLFENSYVEVMQARLAPGESLPPHEGGNRVIYSLTDYEIRFEQQGQEMQRSFSEGDVHFHEAGPHSVENVGDTTARFVVFERLEAALPEAMDTTPAQDLSEEAAPAKQDTLLENDVAEVHVVSLEAGQSLPDHRGRARVIYSLSDYRVRFMQGGDSEERSFEQGSVHYHAPGVHAVENIGDQAARFMVVEFIE
jgi:quercetin dioxygenase-like cupin family protein